MVSPCSYICIFLAIFYSFIPLLESAIFFPSNSAYGIFAAIAVPLDLGPHRNVFVSYNFEANYNLPVNWQLPTYLDVVDSRSTGKKLREETSDNDSVLANVTSNDKTHQEIVDRSRRSILSRTAFYSMLQQKLYLNGYDGESCLLRTICESNSSGITDVNGFLGSVLHIIFGPSLSKDEGLPDIYYKAEFYGKQSKCDRYSKKCPKSILDLISTEI